ncbi:SDR family NAD(P)-dependent oxidoreductase [Paenibacillus daejeonensis]|uniref:SDR family NAD(P)-dependent oxidoreductase n=1 Tax=Paenibacillus daejeonensis TaxID=135193 RepID=UPI0003704C06|nr:SDR family NAD(P)-dependent oxidoreductase [Paenibacillus daejeonensis]
MPDYSLLEKLLFPPVHLDREKLAACVRGKTIAITGASSGIGERLAYLMGEYEVRLILIARREDKLRSMQKGIEGDPAMRAKVVVAAADLRNESEMNAVLSQLQQLPDGLDILVSNAGLSIRRPIEASLERYHDFTRTMAINYFAPVRLMLALIPVLRERKGQIINISTINTALIPLPYWAAYQASKQAFDTWLRSAAPELHAMGIATTSIYLPLVRTPMIEPTASYRDMPAMSADHVSQLIAKSIYSRRSRWSPWWLVFGQLASLTGRGVWERVMPGVLRKRRDKHGSS